MRISQSKISSYPMKMHDDPELAKKMGMPMHPMSPAAPLMVPKIPEIRSPAVPAGLRKKGK